MTSRYVISYSLYGEPYAYCVVADGPTNALVKIKEKWVKNIDIADHIEIAHLDGWEN